MLARYRVTASDWSKTHSSALLLADDDRRVSTIAMIVAQNNFRWGGAMFPNWQVGILDGLMELCCWYTMGWLEGSTPLILVSSSLSLVLMLPWCQCHSSDNSYHRPWSRNNPHVIGVTLWKMPWLKFLIVSPKNILCGIKKKWICFWIFILFRGSF